VSASEVESHLRRGAGEWNRWRDKFQLDKIDVAGIVFPDADLRGADLSGVNFAGAEMPGARFDRANLEGASFAGCVLTGARFIDTNLKDAVLNWSDLANVEFTRCDLRGTDLRETELGGSTWNGSQISKKTRLERIRFDPTHRAFNDGADTLILPKRDEVLNWGLVRVAGALPLFEVSYIGVTSAIMLITSIGYLNGTGFIAELNYPIPLPDRVLWLLLSSFFLFLGSAMYRLACPARIQEFSETQWVEQHGRPRIQYLSASMNRKWQISTALFMFSGGGLGVMLLFERFYVAFEYVMAELQRAGVMFLLF
jgi:hypothetical protein